MNKSIVCFLCFLLVICNCVPAGDTDWEIRVNSVGYRTVQSKLAVMVKPCDSYSIVNSDDNSVVYSGGVTGPEYQKDINQQGWIADFSEYAIPGRYYITAKGGGRSVDFTIADDVYQQPLTTAMRGFYLWRCGCAVSGEYNGNIYSHAPCHMSDGWLDYTGLSKKRHDACGGWHDAGDYGKYVVNACFTIGVLFNAWDHFGDKLSDLKLDVPEAEFVCPDYLNELKWELDWLLTMQYPDDSGRVSHKLTALNFSGFVMPEADLQKRYLTEWSSAATADFAAVMAMAARIYKPFSTEYSAKCLKAAELSYNYLKAYTEDKLFVQGEFSTGGYETSDWDDRLWMAAELWRTTREKQYLVDFEKRAAYLGRAHIDACGWGQLSALGIISYLLDESSCKNADLTNRLWHEMVAVADGIVKTADNDIYGRGLGGKYYWGCNGTIAGQVLLLWTAYQHQPNSKYRSTAEDNISNLLGNNQYGRSYITGIGINPPMHPHDRRSGADGINAPWPGYLVGGGHTATDWIDQQGDYRTNEIAINWQGPLVYAFAALDSWDK